MDKSEYFSRQIKLWGMERQSNLENRRVLIVGAGGLGSSLAYALGTSGIGEIDIVDFDIVSLSNIHRQIAFKLEDRDRYKCDVVAERVREKSPFVSISGHQSSFSQFISKSNGYRADLIIDASDNMDVRFEIERFAKSIETPWIYGSVEEFNGQACLFDKSSLSGIFGTKYGELGGVHAPIVMQIASIQANLAIRYLLGLNVAKDRLYYIYFDKFGDMVLQRFNMPI
jgi:adenylyltransferase/sulfurtransferase